MAAEPAPDPRSEPFRPQGAHGASTSTLLFEVRFHFHYVLRVEQAKPADPDIGYTTSTGSERW